MSSEVEFEIEDAEQRHQERPNAPSELHQQQVALTDSPAGVPGVGTALRTSDALLDKIAALKSGVAAQATPRDAGW